MGDGRWDADFIMKIKGTPWDPEVGEAVYTEVDGNPDFNGEAPQPLDINVKARRMKITKTDIYKYSFTPGCPGCRALEAKKPSQNHNDICRARIEARLSEEEEGRTRVEKRKNVISEAMVDYHEKKARREAETGPAAAGGAQEERETESGMHAGAPVSHNEKRVVEEDVNEDSS